MTGDYLFEDYMGKGVFKKGTYQFIIIIEKENEQKTIIFYFKIKNKNEQKIITKILKKSFEYFEKTPVKNIENFYCGLK